MLPWSYFLLWPAPELFLHEVVGPEFSNPERVFSMMAWTLSTAGANTSSVFCFWPKAVCALRRPAAVTFRLPAGVLRGTRFRQTSVTICA